MNPTELAFWKEATTGVLLMGGQGRRMGNVNKSLLEAGGKTFGMVALEALSLFPKVHISVKHKTTAIPLGYEVIEDMVEAGPLGAIYSVLKSCETGYIFVLSCDMPYMDQGAIAYVLSQADEGFAAVVPTISGQSEPLCAMYSKKAMPTIEAQLEGNIFSLKKMLELVPTKWVDLTGTVHAQKFFNVNRPEDYEKVVLNT